MISVGMAGVEATVTENGTEAESEWVLAHRALSRLARQRAGADAEEGLWLLRARRAGAHVRMGFGSFAEYVERSFGYCGRSTHERLRVAEALEHLPVLGAALESGGLHWSAVRELTRVATAETESAWLEVARGKLSRELEGLVAGARPGDLPNAARGPSARRHVLRFEVEAETFAAFREAMVQLRRSSDGRIDDDGALLAMARAVLGGPRDAGRASYQLSLCVCTECGRGTQAAGGEVVSVVHDVVAMVACDAQQIGHVSRAPSAELGITPSTIGGPPAKASPRAHVGAPVSSSTPHAHAGTRSTQSIPPALRRRVLHRAHHSCQVPGCRNSAYVDVHHLRPRAEGGKNLAANLIVLCGVHHRAVHSGELLIEGQCAEGLRFRHADGSLYGHAADPRALEIYAKVFSALRQLGFRESECRAVLDELRQQATPEPLGTEGLLRAALERITPRRGAPN